MAESRGSAAARREFDREASGYDRTALASMPGYSELHRTLVRGIPFVATRAFRVLELGVGTGALSALLLSEFPHARLTGFDLSPRMIAQARRRLRPFGRRADLHSGRLEDAWEGEFDVVVSALAIHHLTDPQKWKLFRRVYRSLSPGGYFGDGDDHLPEDPVFDFQVRPDRLRGAGSPGPEGSLAEPPGGVARPRTVRPPMHARGGDHGPLARGVSPRRGTLAVLRPGRRLGVQVRCRVGIRPAFPESSDAP